MEVTRSGEWPVDHLALDFLETSAELLGRLPMDRLHRIRKLISPFSIALVVFFDAGRSFSEEWEQESMLLYNASSSPLMLSKARDLGNTRMSLYLKAIIAMHHPPKGELSADEARGVLQQLIEVSDSDQIGVAARFYLARAPHTNNHAEDVTRSSDAYLQLYQDAPNRFFGQMAFLKHLLYYLYEYNGSASAEERLAEMEKMGEGLSIPDLSRSFHHSMGEAYLHFELSDSKAFEHWKRAHEIGFANPSAQADLQLRLGKLAEKIGKLEFAVIVYQDFLKTAPRDDRKTEIAQRLAALTSQMRKPASGSSP